MQQFYSKHGPPQSKSTGVPGWETSAEESALIELARAVPANGIIVEIGGEWGRSASQFAKHAPDGVQVFTVDLFPNNYHDMGLSLLEMHRHNLQLAGVLHRTTQIQGRSDLMAKEWRGGDIDLLFIDGGHGYQQVKADIDAWIGFVKPGGVVAFHDYAKQAENHYLHHQVKMAVDAWYQDGTGYDATEDIIGVWKRTNGPDSLVWFERIITEVDDIPFDDYGFDYEDDNPAIVLVDVLTASIDELKAYGEEHGLKMGRYSKRESVIEKLRKEGLL